MPNTIDELMDKDPLGLSSKDLDDIIAYERRQRGLFDVGVKPKKFEGEKKDLDMAILANILPRVEPAPKPKIGRRI